MLQFVQDVVKKIFCYLTNALGHDEDDPVTKLPTCSENGKISYPCKRCGYERTEELSISPIAHNYVGGVCTICGTQIYKFHDSVETIDSVAINGKSYDIVTFGDYPQTIKDGNVIIDETNSTKMGAFTYYLGSDGNYYTEKYEKYYKVEPIKWRVLTESKTNGKLLLAENILYYVKYLKWNYSYQGEYYTAQKRNEIYFNNYEHSQLRASLNGLSYIDSDAKRNNQYYNNGFLQTAFTDSASKKIKTSTVDNKKVTDYGNNINDNGEFAGNNTSDKIFILSVYQATNPNYGFGDLEPDDNARKKNTTDFCGNVVNGWWTRTPGYYGTYNSTRAYNVHLGYCAPTNVDNAWGVVPALYVMQN